MMQSVIIYSLAITDAVSYHRESARFTTGTVWSSGVISVQRTCVGLMLSCCNLHWFQTHEFYCSSIFQMRVQLAAQILVQVFKEGSVRPSTAVWCVCVCACVPDYNSCFSLALILWPTSAPHLPFHLVFILISLPSVLLVGMRGLTADNNIFE